MKGVVVGSGEASFVERPLPLLSPSDVLVSSHVRSPKFKPSSHFSSSLSGFSRVESFSLLVFVAQICMHTTPRLLIPM